VIRGLFFLVPIVMRAAHVMQLCSRVSSICLPKHLPVNAKGRLRAGLRIEENLITTSWPEERSRLS
jgi:hypothetical protein